MHKLCCLVPFDGTCLALYMVYTCCEAKSLARVSEGADQCCWRQEVLKSMHDSDGCFFGWESFILKSMMFCDITSVLNERKHLKMVTRSVLDSVSLNLDQTE